MFASLKNKIREETGSDLSKLTSKLSTAAVQQRIDSFRGRHSRTGSTTSINSIVSLEGTREDSTTTSNDSSRTEEDHRKQIAKIESEFNKRLEIKDVETKEQIDEKDRRISLLEKENQEAFQAITNLKAALNLAEENKKKLVEYQEDKEQIENFQTQELSKVKQLVLLRDQELAEKSALLKENSQQLEKLRVEVTRLRRLEQQLNDVQDDLESLRHSSARDLAALASELARSEEERRHLSDLVAVLRQRTTSESTDDGDQLLTERKLLEQRLEEAHLHLADIKTSWSDKIASLETQVGRLSRQAAEEGAERRRAVQEKDALLEKLKQLECELECNRLELNNKETKIIRLTGDVEELSTELKNIRSETEEEVTFLRNQIKNLKTESTECKKHLQRSELDLDKTEDECSKLRISVESEHQANESLRQLIQRLEQELNEEKAHSTHMQQALNREASEKNTALLRNAEISQQMELAKQETRRQESEMLDLINRISQLEQDICRLKDIEEKLISQDELKLNIANLEEQMTEKNKSIKTLQMKLADMKKTLQQELRTPGQQPSEQNNSAAVLTPSQSSTKQLPTAYSSIRKDDDDINFKYLKHVIIKFLTSREYEAQHLTRAVATLLKFSPEEEKLLHDTLEWKMSWFGSKPNLGIGQTAKAIPPS